MRESKEFRRKKEMLMAAEENTLRKCIISIAKNDQELDRALDLSEVELQKGTLRLLKAIFPRTTPNARRAN